MGTVDVQMDPMFESDTMKDTVRRSPKQSLQLDLHLPDHRDQCLHYYQLPGLKPIAFQLQS